MRGGELRNLATALFPVFRRQNIASRIALCIQMPGERPLSKNGKMGGGKTHSCNKVSDECAELQCIALVYGRASHENVEDLQR